MTAVQDLQLIVVAAVMATMTTPSFGRTATSLKNGRKVVIMSMDGFRHDYLSRGAQTPNFDALMASGVTMPYLDMTFATLTFPSHYTLATGLYEESHGIVGNKMYDPKFNAKFGFGNTETRWWDGAEPIWINAVKAGHKAGVFFWPGSEAELDGLRPTKWMAYDSKVPFKERVDTLVTEWLSKQDFDFGMIYFNEPDHSGHKYGPEAPEMIPVIERMDGILGYFMQKLEEKNLKGKVDFIITSDHGMTALNPEKRIQLNEYLNDTLLADVVGGGAFAHLIPQPGKDQELVDAISGIEHVSVYLKENIPDEYHYKHNRRIMPVLIVAEDGWEVREKFYSNYYLKGNHGFKPSYMSMRPIFIASGPSFKKGEKVDPMVSVDVYPLLCHLLDLAPAPNNGSFFRVEPLLKVGGPVIEDAATSNSPPFLFVSLCFIITVTLF